MSNFDNIGGIYAKDTELRSGIDTLRNTVISNTIKPITITESGVYTANPSSGVYGYSPVTVNVDSGLDYIEQVDYLFTSSSDSAGITLTLQPNDILEADLGILRTSGEQTIFGNGTIGSELYIENSRVLTYGSRLNWTEDTDTTDVAVGERRIFKGKLITSGPYLVNIFTYRGSDLSTYPIYCKVYGIKLIRNNVEIMNLVPAKVHNMGVYGILYDTINHYVYRSTAGADFSLPTAE